MSAAVTATGMPVADPHRLGRPGGSREATGHGEGGPASRKTIVGFGFWIFLLSDIIIFSALFATYAVLHTATDGGPASRQLFDLDNVGVETVLLLLSSFTCGFGILSAKRHRMIPTQLWLLATGLLGVAFLVLELREFHSMILAGAGPHRSAFLSSFFALVGCHGLHVTCGLLWLGTMMAQIATRGFGASVQRRLMCFSLFWHALDIIWVAVFTVVYLLGVPL